eukprot:807633_1
MMKQKQWQIVPTFIFLSLCTHTSCSANWLCNQSLWTSNSSVDAWVFESNSNDNHNCSVVSPREYALSILWIGNHYNESLNWSNYRITVCMELLNGINAGIVVRLRDPTLSGYVEGGKSYHLAIVRSSLVIWKVYAFGKPEPVVSMHHQYSNTDFWSRVLNVTITMDVFDNRFVVYIDGVFIVEYMDNCDPIMRGSIGIISYSSTARFTYFSVELNQSHIPSQTYSILTKKEQYALKQIYQ